MYMYNCRCTHVHVHVYMYNCRCTHVHVHAWSGLVLVSQLSHIFQCIYTYLWACKINGRAGYLTWRYTVRGRKVASIYSVHAPTDHIIKKIN